jgi:hypothetical protein
MRAGQGVRLGGGRGCRGYPEQRSQPARGGGGWYLVDTFIAMLYSPHQITRHNSKVQAPAQRGTSRLSKGPSHTAPEILLPRECCVVVAEGDCVNVLQTALHVCF